MRSRTPAQGQTIAPTRRGPGAPLQPPLSSTTAKDAPTSQPTHERALGAPRKGIFKGPKMSTGAGPAKPTAALAHSIQAGIGGQAPATTTSYCMTSLPSTPVPASASDPKCSQQTPADMDHSYHNNQDNQTGHASLGKRPTDINGDSAELSMTFAEQQAAEVITMDHESTEGDLEGFILVQHRRQRTTGVPVLLTPSNETQRLQQLNPLMLSTDVNTAAGGPIIRHQFTARGGLLVEVAEVSSVNKLMQVQTLGGIPVQVTIPTTYLQNFGLIKGVPLWYTDAQLAEFLQPEGVVAARRHYRRRGKPGDAATPSDRVVLTFRPNTERPSKVNLGFTRHEVAEYIEAPPRCYNCQALGHIAKYCKQSPKCKKCGEPHLTKDCKGEAPMKCANCGGNHPADYVNCKVRLTALKKTKNFIRGPRQSPPRTDDPPPLESFPPLVQETSNASSSVQETSNASPPQKEVVQRNKKKMKKPAPPTEQTVKQNVPANREF